MSNKHTFDLRLLFLAAAALIAALLLLTVPSGEVLVHDLKANYPGGQPILTNLTSYEVYTVEA